MDIQKYYSSIRARMAELDPDTEELARRDPSLTATQHFKRSNKIIWLVSIDNEERGSVAGQASEANPFVAAECLYWKTHVLASDEQIAQEVERRARKKDEILAADAAAKQTVNTTTTVKLDATEFAEAVVTAQANAQQARRQPGRAQAQPDV